MALEPIKSDFGVALINIMRSAIENKNDSLVNAASLLEQLIESGDLPKKYEFFAILYGALAYDIANEQFDAQRLYKLLFKTQQPNLEYLVSSRINSENLSNLFGHAGLRERKPYRDILEGIISYLKMKKEFEGEFISEEYKDDYAVLFSILSLMNDLFMILEKREKEKITSINFTANKFYQDLEKFTPDSWIELVSTLYLELIRRITERSIIKLDISDRMKKILYNKKIEELWIPQKNAVDLGLLDGKNMLYSSPPGTGKSFLAYLSAGKLSVGKQTVYLVPSRSLSTQVFDDLSDVLGSEYKIAVSDSDRTADDEHVDEKDIVVATYEKMDALLRRKKIDPSKIQNVIVDELQFLGESRRGLTIELMLTKFLKNKSPIQLIGLSGLLNEENSNQIAEWMNARLMRSDWKGIKTEEMIFFNGTLYHKNGDTEKVPISLPISLSVYDKRKLASSYFCKSAIAKNEPILISVIKREQASKLANDLKEQVRTFNLFDMDLMNRLEKNKSKYDAIINKIKNIEPEIPEFAEELISMIKTGIVYHHAGLPRIYRSIIENAIKNNIIDIIVATPTLEAGVNFPIKTVLFFDPKFNVGKSWHIMENRKYKNIAGRAGRPGYHKKANVIVLAMKDTEFYTYKKQFWRADLEPIRSSFYEIINESKSAMSSLYSHLLGYVTEYPESDLDSIVHHLTNSWFWKQSQSARDTQAVLDSIERSLSSLVDYKFLNKLENGKYVTTTIGKIVNESMLPPDSAVNMITSLEYLFSNEFNEEDHINMILVLTSLSTELHKHDKIVKNIIIPQQIQKLKIVFENIGELFLEPDQLHLALKYASVLYYWINSYSTSRIIEFCRLKSQSLSAFIEEELVKDAHRILLSISAFAESVQDSKHDFSEERITKTIDLINSVSDFCRDGSKESFIRTLLNSNLSHIRRASAIKISEYLKLKEKNILSLTEEEFVGIFPTNEKTAKTLFEEILEFRDLFMISND